MGREEDVHNSFDIIVVHVSGIVCVFDEVYDS